MEYGSLNEVLNEESSMARKILSYPAGALGGIAGGIGGAFSGAVVGPRILGPKVAYTIRDALQKKNESTPRTLARYGAEIAGAGLGGGVGALGGLGLGAVLGAKAGMNMAQSKVDPDYKYEVKKDKDIMRMVNWGNQELDTYYDYKKGYQYNLRPSEEIMKRRRQLAKKQGY